MKEANCVRGSGVLVFVSIVFLIMLHDTSVEVPHVKAWDVVVTSASMSRHTITKGAGGGIELSYDGDVRNDVNSPCTRQENVVYIKTHKTGSTTLQSIVYRYGFIRNLSFVIRKTNPINGHIRYLKVTKESPKKMFLPLIGEGECIFRNYSMSVVHVVHNMKVFETFMNPGTLYITILRNPVAQFLSSFVFFNLGNNTKGDTSEKKLLNYLKGSYWKKSSYGRNSQSKDLGLKRDDFNNASKIKHFISQLDKELHFVLISEYYDESIVLLARDFCWSLEDVLFTIQNIQPNRKPEISPKLLDEIRIFNHADFLLYDHFNKTFWKRIQAQGPPFWEDLGKFKRLQNETMYRCFNNSTIPTGYTRRENASEYCDQYFDDGLLFRQVWMKQNKTCITISQ